MFDIHHNKGIIKSVATWEEALVVARNRFYEDDCVYLDIYAADGEWKGGAWYLFGNRNKPKYHGALNIDMGADYNY